MSAILGIDAAWTPHHPSGVAVVRSLGSNRWECVALGSSYEGFLRGCNIQTDLDQVRKDPVGSLLDAAQTIAKTKVNLIVADIPLSRGPITGRRFADDEISRHFGGFGVSTHSPSVTRPGKISVAIRDGFEKKGFSLATCRNHLSGCCFVESFPHPALLSLMRTGYRFPYKVTKTKNYWPHLDRHGRIERLVRNLRQIRDRLSENIDGVDLDIPDSPASFSWLKSIEDKLDALICAWIGIQIREDRAISFGDAEAAIWLPSDLLDRLQPSPWSRYLRSGAVASEEFMQNVEDLPAEEVTL